MHRQRVHVRTQQDPRPQPRARQPRDDGRRALSRSDVEIETVEGLDHRCLRPWQREAELGVSVNATAKLDRIVEKAPGVVEDL